METAEDAQNTICVQLTSDDSDVREEYLELFEDDIKLFAKPMAEAYTKWRSFDSGEHGDERHAYVSSLVYTAITLHILSTKLLLSGQTVASGNLLRQVFESISLALLCSGKELDVLKRFIEDQYSSNNAVRDVLRHGKILSLHDDALEILRKAQDFYHKYSHVTKLTIAAGMSFSQQGGLYVGAAFDEGKIEEYKKEVAGRVSLAEVFPNFVDGVSANVAKW